jgi:hypothetical protein
VELQENDKHDENNDIEDESYNDDEVGNVGHCLSLALSHAVTYIHLADDSGYGDYYPDCLQNTS